MRIERPLSGVLDKKKGKPNNKERLATPGTLLSSSLKLKHNLLLGPQENLQVKVKLSNKGQAVSFFFLNLFFYENRLKHLLQSQRSKKMRIYYKKTNPNSNLNKDNSLQNSTIL